MEEQHLDRFVKAQQEIYPTALAEIKSGKKRSHWMWYIFPQLKGLGHSSTSKFYGINDIFEAKAFLAHPILGPRLKEISRALLVQDTNDAIEIMGHPDNLKLMSSMTLFAEISDPDPVFERVLEKFFDGKKDQNTLHLLGKK